MDKNNLERLRFYAVLKPEKLEKSFRYMSQKIARYLRHRNRPLVILYTIKHRQKRSELNLDMLYLVLKQ